MPKKEVTLSGLIEKAVDAEIARRVEREKAKAEEELRRQEAIYQSTMASVRKCGLSVDTQNALEDLKRLGYGGRAYSEMPKPPEIIQERLWNYHVNPTREGYFVYQWDKDRNPYREDDPYEHKLTVKILGQAIMLTEEVRTIKGPREVGTAIYSADEVSREELLGNIAGIICRDIRDEPVAPQNVGLGATR